MNKSYKNKERYKVYRGIVICINSCYSYKRNKVVVMFPDVERYFKNESGVRSAIDKFLKNYKPEPSYYNGEVIPF